MPLPKEWAFFSSLIRMAINETNKIFAFTLAWNSNYSVGKQIILSLQ